MEEWDPGAYGERWADVYDERMVEVGVETEAAVSLLAELARGGPVLELGIGTGRAALPLARQGLEVHGIEASQAMVEELHAKPGGDRINVFVGDFAEVDVEGSYRLIFVLVSTFFQLLTQEDQLRCFENVAARLTADGVFVIEASVPELSGYKYGQSLGVKYLGSESVVLYASEHDPSTQRISSADLEFRDGNFAVRPGHMRYAWPSELDLMARLAGLQLRDRWGGWGRDPFTAASGMHLSVYGRA